MGKVVGRAYTVEEKQAVLRRLEAVWLQYPDMRLGQLLNNATQTAEGEGPDLFYTEDLPLCDEVEEYLLNHPPKE